MNHGITLKNVKHSPSLSEETEAFTADLYVNGKKTAHCRNDGRGGCTFVDCVDDSPKTRERINLAEAHALLRDHPIAGCEWRDGRDALEGLVDDLLTDWLMARELKKTLKKQLVIATGDSLRGLSWRGVRSLAQVPAAALDQARTRLLRDHPGAKILNDLPFDEALALYRDLA